MNKNPKDDSRYIPRQQLQDWLKSTPTERLRFIEESKEFLKKVWDSKTIKIVEKLRQRGF